MSMRPSEVPPVFFVSIAHPHFRGKLPQNAHIAQWSCATFWTTQKNLPLILQQRACHRGLHEVPPAYFVYIASLFRGQLPKTVHIAHRPFLALPAIQENFTTLIKASCLSTQPPLCVPCIFRLHCFPILGGDYPKLPPSRRMFPTFCMIPGIFSTHIRTLFMSMRPSEVRPCTFVNIDHPHFRGNCPKLPISLICRFPRCLPSKKISPLSIKHPACRRGLHYVSTVYSVFIAIPQFRGKLP